MKYQQGATKLVDFHLEDYRGESDQVQAALSRLEGVPGVQRAHFVADSQNIMVTYEAGMTTEEHMRGLIQEYGFRII